MSKLLIIDGSAILHRAYHALPPFKSPDGVPTNAVYGFIKMLFSLCDKISPDYLTVCFDTPKPSFRKELLKTYQAQRPKADEDYKVQIPLVQKFVSQATLSSFAKEGFEADDVIGTVAHQAVASNPQLKVFIVTGDKDLLQLVNGAVTLIMPKKGVSEVDFLDEEGVYNKMQVKPSQIVFYKALVGDPSDNYKGIKGIGPKKAIWLINKYQTLDNLYQHLEELDEKTSRLLQESESEARLSEQLARIVLEVEINFTLAQTTFSYQQINNPQVINFLNSLGLRSVVKQLDQKNKPKIKPVIMEKDDQLNLF
jgi:DNA polymerase-1